MTNVRQLALPQWRRLAAKPENRCVVPLTEFAEFTPDKHDPADGTPPLKGEMWFSVTDQPVFAVGGFWQRTAAGDGFTMVICDPNSLVAPIHPKAMITILAPGDIDTWLRGSYDDVVALQRPYAPTKMTVRGPVFKRAAVPKACVAAGQGVPGAPRQPGLIWFPRLFGARPLQGGRA
jgi:putative SOS response-associated peptidase YedK